MKQSAIMRRNGAAARFKILPFYDWAGQNYGGVGSVPDDHEALYEGYLERKVVEAKALGLVHDKASVSSAISFLA